MKLFFVKGYDGYDENDPYLILADNKKEAEKIFAEKKGLGELIKEDNFPMSFGKAGEGIKLKKGIIWKQLNAG